MQDTNKSQETVSDPTLFTEISDPAVFAKKPLVSVHMITYNHAPYIARAIEGVLQQETNFPIELVIGEDCSTDRTGEIVLNFQKKFPNIIRVITSGNNVGAHKNGHRVTKACRGKYIAFCEGDDYWHNPMKLQIQLDYLEEHPECGLVFSNADVFYVMTGEKIVNNMPEINLTDHSSTLIGIILQDITIRTCTVVVRCDIYEIICQECSYELSEKFWMGDYQTWVEFAYRSKVKHVDKSLATYNLLQESASQMNDIDRRIKLWINSREIFLHYVNKYGGNHSGKLKKIIARRSLDQLIRPCYESRNGELIIDIVEDARKHGVTLGIKNYLYFISSKNNLSSSIIRFCFYFILRFWGLLRHIKWLRAIRGRLMTDRKKSLDLIKIKGGK